MNALCELYKYQVHAYKALIYNYKITCIIIAIICYYYYYYYY